MQYQSLEFKSSQVSIDQRTFEGYAATWDLDRGGDIIAPGAFTKTLKEASNRVKILWQHRDPLGKPLEMREDSVGLYVKGYVSKTALGDEALELMRDLVVDRMSIGYQVPNGKAIDNDDGTRTLTELKLLEFSPVTFPMNEGAVITGVKELQEQMARRKHFSDVEIAQLATTVNKLNALIKGEPLADTRPDYQPQTLAALADAIERWGV